MEKSVLTGKSILAVNDDPEVLAVLRKEVLKACPNCTFDTATTFTEASQKLASYTYHLVILDNMGVRDLEILKRAALKRIPVAMVNGHELAPEALKRSIDMGVQACLPREEWGEIVLFLENVLTYKYLPVWKRFYEKMKGFFGTKSGSDWEKSMDTRAILIYQN